MLASASPRRADLLHSVGLRFEVVPADIDETRHDGEAAKPYVERLAREKLAKVAKKHTDALVIAADTCVAREPLDVLGKPVDNDDARAMLLSLSGRGHLVHTGVAVANSGQVAAAVATTAVFFYDLDEATIDWYLATGEALDKAGGYAMQGYGGVFVRWIDGSPSNVVGLPLHLVAELAHQTGVELSAFRIPAGP